MSSTSSQDLVLSDTDIGGHTWVTSVLEDTAWSVHTSGHITQIIVRISDPSPRHLNIEDIHNNKLSNIHTSTFPFSGGWITRSS